MYSRVNLLVADNDEDYRLLFVKAMSEVLPSFNTHYAKDGSECLNIIKQTASLDLIFLDIGLPAVNAFECLKTIKAGKGLKDVPVIICSHSHEIKDIESAYQNGATLFLVKSTNFNLLARLLKQLLKALGRPKKDLLAKENFVIAEKTIPVV